MNADLRVDTAKPWGPDIAPDLPACPVEDVYGSLRHGMGDLKYNRRNREIVLPSASRKVMAMEADQAHYRAVFEQTGVGVCHIALDGRFLRANEKYCAIVGYDCTELLGLGIRDITHPDDIAPSTADMAQLTAGPAPSRTWEFRHVRKNKALVWTRVSLSLVRKATGEPGYFVAIVEDIHQCKQLESALDEERGARHSIVERQVAERTAKLLAANRQLEAVLYATSHDLKGPLGRISSFSGLLERDYRDRLEGDGLVMLDFIRDNATRLTRLIDDLLAHARIDQQATHLQPVELQACVQATLREKLEDFRGIGAVIRVELPAVHVLADLYGLNQALQNLLENAFKYSSDIAEPVIEIGGAEVDGRFRLWIRDNGIGFNMEYHDTIFELFRRLHTYNEYAGTGVGLALVKRAMEHMGGKVWAESEPGQGATFYLEFQIAR